MKTPLIIIKPGGSRPRALRLSGAGAVTQAETLGARRFRRVFAVDFLDIVAGGGVICGRLLYGTGLFELMAIFSGCGYLSGLFARHM